MEIIKLENEEFTNDDLKKSLEIIEKVFAENNAFELAQKAKEASEKLNKDE